MDNALLTLAATLPQPTHRGAPPNDPRAWIMRAAGDAIGPERLAVALKLSPRSLYRYMAGRRAVPDGVLLDTRNLLVLQRQTIGAIGHLIRQELSS